jgi:hypothetical protein
MSLTSSGNYPDDYRVIIAPSSESSEPTVSYFENFGEIIMTVAPESWSAAVSNPGDGISEHSIDLKNSGEGYADDDVWVAFVLITGDGGGSYLAIDDIKIVKVVLRLLNSYKTIWHHRYTQIQVQVILKLQFSAKQQALLKLSSWILQEDL